MTISQMRSLRTCPLANHYVTVGVKSRRVTATMTRPFLLAASVQCELQHNVEECGDLASALLTGHRTVHENAEL